MSWGGDDGVSPVIGTILVLAITVFGIAALMVWGGPIIDRVQGQNAANAMQGEFEGLRDASQELSVPDHSRFPAVALPRGEIGIATGTRFMVTANHDPANPTCDLRMTGWGGTVAVDHVTLAAVGCRAVTASNFDVYSVSGTTLSKMTATVGATVTVTGADFHTGDWMFRITDGAASPLVYAEAWLHSSDRITWTLPSAVAPRALYLEGGAIFSQTGSTTFLAKAPPINDASFGVGYYGLWLRTYAGLNRGTLTQAGTHQVYLALSSNDLHVDNNTVSSLRYTFSGDLAQAWCNALLARNPTLTGAAYAQDASATCAAGDAQGIRSVTFAYTANAPFQFRFLHARIQSSLVQ